MPVTLATVLRGIEDLQEQNSTNASLIQEFYLWMKVNDKSEAYQKNNLKAIMNFTLWLQAREPRTTLFEVNKKELILKYLSTKEKTKEQDHDGKWITTWNDYLDRIKVFYRWIYNYRNVDEKQRMPPSEWKTPDFIQLKHKKSKRASPYSANQIWELEELQFIIKYEPQQRNKAAIMLEWDLDARNHEVTNIDIKNIRLRENYAEGEIPEGKTGSGPILLTASFPYVRDWLNSHPSKDNPDARLICDLNTGKPLKPDHLWAMMQQLRKRIQTLLKDGQIRDQKEREKLEYLLQTKKWNPYCIRHSAITHDSDYLPGYALNKKVRWTMTSKQPSRYIKNRMGNTLKNTILEHNGIITDKQARPKATSRICPKCNLVNALENDYCSAPKCGYPLTIKAYDQIKAAENDLTNRLEKVESDNKILMEFVTGVMHGKIRPDPTPTE